VVGDNNMSDNQMFTLFAVLIALTMFGLGWLWSYQINVQSIITECELNLTRSQHCVLTAVPEK
jgi:type VI protein secretion system component VasK